MSRQISRAEAWEKAHEAFDQVNFNSFDFNTIKESLLDYLKLYFPEDFNDYIESSELIALLELFAYVGELLAYRVDLNAHENFITTAQRKESILRLSKLLSYSASRNIPARGLVKITSIQTSENIVDSTGANLVGQRINWNDPTNPNWKEQFLTVMNRVLEQRFGTVSPGDRVQVDDVVFELYSWMNTPLQGDGRTVIPYSAAVSNGTIPMELVPTELTDNGPVEKRPELNEKMTVMFADDGLGDSSETTGFLLFTKQGTLNRETNSFDGITPNQTFEINASNINDTDVWVNNIDPQTQRILETNPAEGVFPHLTSENFRFGEWVEIKQNNTQNILFNTTDKRQKFEIETLPNDQIRIIFGDGEFADIPAGLFEFWYRTSQNQQVNVPRSSVLDQRATFTYIDQVGTTQTLTFTFSLVGSLQNNSPSEELEHIRRVAPSVYYSQNRMVNGRDYNTFMLQDPSIMKLRTINRTFAGDSKYIAWHDPSESYENVKMFGDDLALYWDERDPEQGASQQISRALTPNQLLLNVIEPLLSTTEFFATIGEVKENNSLNAASVKKQFTSEEYSFSSSGDNELDNLIQQLEATRQSKGDPVDIYYTLSVNNGNVNYEEWIANGDMVGGSQTNPELRQHPCVNQNCPAAPDVTIWMIRVFANFDNAGQHNGWTVSWRTRQLTAHSEQTRFWNTNQSDQILNFDTLSSLKDQIVVLKANVNANKTGVLQSDKNFNVLAQRLIDINPSLPNNGLPDIHRLSVLPSDDNNDGIADNLSQPEMFDRVIEGTWPISSIDGGTVSGTTIIDLGAIDEKYNNHPQKGLDNDIQIYVDGSRRTFADDELFVDSGNPTDLVQTLIETDDLTGLDVKIVIRDFVYFTRETVLSSWVPKPDTTAVRNRFITQDVVTLSDALYKRHRGRYPLNFGWFHYTPNQRLIDPASSNIHDMYVVTRGYYNALLRFLQGRTDIQPTEPTPLDLQLAFSDLLENQMLSDTVIMHPGVLKILFGEHADQQLQAKLKVIRPNASSLTNSEVKSRIVDATRRFFNPEQWEFGETYYFTEHAAFIHAELGPEIDSVVLVPTSNQSQFGDLFQIQARENEMFIPELRTTDIDVVTAYTPENIRM